jgi:hypothetical protein
VSIPFLLLSLSVPNSVHAQQLVIDSFAVFGGNGLCPFDKGQTTCLSPGCSVIIGSSTNINGGSIGSFKLIQANGTNSLSSNLVSGGSIVLKNNSSVKGKISVTNILSNKGIVLQAGTSTKIVGDIDVAGNSTISTSGSSSVTGKVTHPSGTTYTGPTPSLGNFTIPPSLPTLPIMPPISVFPAVGTTNIKATQIISPGSYGNITLSGNQTITLSGTGIYVFNSIQCSGSTNNFVFDFKNDPTGTIKIFVYGDVNLNKCSATLPNGGSANRIYSETHGNGKSYNDATCAWNIANGSTTAISKWLGTIWSPYAAVYIGTGSGQTNFTGAIWSGTQVSIGNSVNITFAPFQNCSTPNVNAGLDQRLTCDTPFIQLNGTSTTNNVSYSWTELNGLAITSGANTANPTVSNEGTYILKVTNLNGGCSATDTVLVKFIPCILPYYPPPVNGKVANTNLIGAELSSLAANFGHVTDTAKAIFLIQGDSVFVEVISLVGQTQTLSNLLQSSYGLTDTVNNGPGSLIITGKIPIANLTSLNSLTTLIDFVRPLSPPLRNIGIITSQGDSVIHSNFVRGGYDISGKGVKIGVISDSYNSLLGNPEQTDILNGDLPGIGNSKHNTPVKVLKEYPYGSSTDEGRAMLQIIHDIAPDATLDFRTGFISAGDFAQGILELQKDGCDIIVDDVTYINDPFFQDGPISKAIDSVAAKGVTYFAAAGNYGSQSYAATFNPVPAPNGIVGYAHNFGGSIFQNDSLYAGTYTLVLQWQDSVYSLGQTSPGTSTDLDIYLTDGNGKTLFGFNRNNVTGDPIEILPFTVTTSTAANLMIIQANGNKPVNFKYVVFRGKLKMNNFSSGNSTIVGHANAQGGMAVGAVRYTRTPAYGINPSELETFSSMGGTTVNSTVRNKPDFVAPDGVSTTVNFGSINISGTSFPSFFGTSAAAPHAAAVAALLIEGKKKYANETITPEKIKTLLINSALPIAAPGFNFSSGNGLIQADSAMKTFAAPKPVATKIIVTNPDPTIVPGTQPLDVTIKGNFFDNNTQVLFRGTALPTALVNSTTVNTTIPTFLGNPPIQTFNTPKSSVGNDGGASDT